MTSLVQIIAIICGTLVLLAVLNSVDEARKKQKQRKGNGGDLYGWNISDLNIYKKPKELNRLSGIDKEYVKDAHTRTH